MPRPSQAELLASAGRTVRDVIAPDLRVLFCGINPGLYTSLTGHHFAGPGNRFWKALHASGFTPRVLLAAEKRELLDHGLGVTNVVPRASATAAELSATEIAAGARRLRAKVLRWKPRALAILGVGAYRVGFDRPKATVGEQPRADDIGSTRVWVLPNPSGLNANYSSADIAALFADLRASVTRARRAPASTRD